jgi:hypothetical protein
MQRDAVWAGKLGGIGIGFFSEYASAVCVEAISASESSSNFLRVMEIVATVML